MMQRLAALLLALGAFLGTSCASAAPAPEHHPLWVIQSGKNSVYLLGSVHVLRTTDYPLPDALENAYRDAEVLYMEIDLDDLDQAEATAYTMGNGALPPDSSLAQVLGPTQFEAAQQRASSLGIDLTLFSHFEPWVVAIGVLQIQLNNLGLDVKQGIEQHFMREAERDHKEILGLEKLEDQLGVLDALPLKRQGDFLMMSLEDAQNMQSEIDELIRAWRTGDARAMAKTLSVEFDDFPELYPTLIVARNRSWAEQIAKLVGDDKDYLVIVGALHLVGKDSVLELLRGKGLKVKQL